MFDDLFIDKDGLKKEIESQTNYVLQRPDGSFPNKDDKQGVRSIKSSSGEFSVIVDPVTPMEAVIVSLLDQLEIVEQKNITQESLKKQLEEHMRLLENKKMEEELSKLDWWGPNNNVKITDWNQDYNVEIKTFSPSAFSFCCEGSWDTSKTITSNVDVLVAAGTYKLH